MYGAEAAMIAGIGFGIFGALMGELCNRVFYMHGKTHVDPPAFGIFMSGLLSAILIAAGVFSPDTIVAWPQFSTRSLNRSNTPANHSLLTPL